MKNLIYFFTGLICLAFVQCDQERQLSAYPYPTSKIATGDSAMIVSPHPLSTEVGLMVLRDGGNAVDAAIAVQFAMAVVYPRAGNIGGGGFMVIRLAGGELAALDYREKAPLAATRKMYQDENGNVIDGISREGVLAVGVPGTVAGMVAAHEKYGKLEFRRLLEPAVKLAEQGFQVTGTEANRLNGYHQEFIKNNGNHIPFVKPGKWAAGDTLIQSELANTLKRIRDQSSKGFYTGKTADSLVKLMQQKNGLITYEDLAQYQATWRDPVTTQYRNHKIVSMPPSSSGGVALVQMLKMVEPFDLEAMGFHSTGALHLMTEAERRAYADRALYLGDMDFYPVPVDSLIRSEYLAQQMRDFDPGKATVSKNVQSRQFRIRKESYETTHTSVIDREGNAVSVTTTLNSNFGSKVMVAGFFLNNEMDDFSVKPGVPNQFGLVGAEANAIEPGKRMLSSMTPTIVLKNNQPFLILGSPGGSTIITSVFQVIVNVIDFKLSLPEAVEAARFHHQWLPDRILVERGEFSPGLLDSLQSLGHHLEETGRMGVVKAIQVLDDGSYLGVGDSRNPDDSAAGF